MLESKIFKNIPKAVKKELEKERISISEEKNNKVYKIKVIQLLEDIYKSKDELKEYNKLLYQALIDVYKSAVNSDYSIEHEYLKNKKEIIKHILWNKTPNDRITYSDELQIEFEKLNKVLKKSHKKLLVHRWIVSKIEEYDTFNTIENDTGLFKKFKENQASKIYKMFKMNENKQKIKLYLQGLVIDFLAKESKEHIDENQYELKFMD